MKTEELIKASLEKEQQAQYIQDVLADYKLAVISREASLIGRKEVLTGKAKFGILGDGKEVPQIAMARAFKKGDWRAGYYRDQTFMFKTGLSTVEQFFSQLYADCENDPFSGGRQMNSHYASPTVDSNGEWLNLVDSYNVSADISCTAGQMPRALGLALASKYFRNNAYEGSRNLSNHGNEVAFVTIGDSSTSEGVFWETMNAAAVMQVPLLVAVWDDGYGISVPKELQTVKASISKALEGFRIEKKSNGLHIVTVNGWDYQELCIVFEEVSRLVREEHIPALIHVQELTQPQGHSTSGSHERYKSKERLQWEKEYDCLVQMRRWILENGFCSEAILVELEQEAKSEAKKAKEDAWAKYTAPLKKNISTLNSIISEVEQKISDPFIQPIKDDIKSMINPLFGEILQQARRLSFVCDRHGIFHAGLKTFINDAFETGHQRYHTHLYSETPKAAINVPVVPPTFDDGAEQLNGYQVINKFFDQLFQHNPDVLAFGEDVGKIGDVNQGFAGLQEKYGVERIFDTGIRELTIMGQAVGAANRGLRPIAEIQYLDYLAFGFSPLTDDLATLRYRSNGIQAAPAIIRTRGHRLEGIWHAGSPLGMMVHSMRGIHICTPRNMVQAAGMYNTLMKSDDPGIVIECLNGYRLKESMPTNLSEFTVPLGVPEVLVKGEDVTLVTYGSCVREALKGLHLLEPMGVSVELIDAQTLLPFDLEGVILESLKKTNRIIFMDEDVPGGATAYMMQEVLEKQNGYQYLDAKPKTLTAYAHRTPFGSDGDYFTKPGPEDVYEAVLAILSE